MSKTLLNLSIYLVISTTTKLKLPVWGLGQISRSLEYCENEKL